MRYRRSTGTMREQDWQQVMTMLNHYLDYKQQDAKSTNEQINDIKLMIHKLEQHMNLPRHRTYSFNHWS